MKKDKTKQQLHEEKKKELAESIEYLRQIDLPESQGGGRKFVQDTRKEEKRIDKEEQDQAKNYLESRKSQQFGYRERLADYAMRHTYTLDLELGWEYNCLPTSGAPINIYGKRFKTQEGVVHVLKSPKNEIFMRAVGITYEPEIDMKNIGIMFEQVRNTIDSAKGILLSDNKDTRASLKRTKSGIFLPN